MTLEDWLANRWLVEHETSSEEVADLWSVVERDLRNAKVEGLDPDWQLAIAHNAALQIATLALAAEGYRPSRDRSHERAIESLRYTLKTKRSTIDVLDAVRRKRNLSNYERAGAVSQSEADELYQIARDLLEQLKEWLKANHPNLLND
jgi:hypothetical protein